MPRVLKDHDLRDAAKRRALAKKDPNRDTFWHGIKLQSLALGWRRNGRVVVRGYGPGTGYRNNGQLKALVDDAALPTTTCPRWRGCARATTKQAEDAALKATLAKATGAQKDRHHREEAGWVWITPISLHRDQDQRLQLPVRLKPRHRPAGDPDQSR